MLYHALYASRKSVIKLFFFLCFRGAEEFIFVFAYLSRSHVVRFVINQSFVIDLCDEVVRKLCWRPIKPAWIKSRKPEIRKKGTKQQASKVMSKTKQSYGMDFDDEASKLLEKALSSFDGIILGESPLEVQRRLN